jgi:hypothetical protein
MLESALLFCIFWYSMIYMFKCYEIFTVVYWEHILATVICVKFIVYFWYMSINTP